MPIFFLLLFMPLFCFYSLLLTEGGNSTTIFPVFSQVHIIDSPEDRLQTSKPALCRQTSGVHLTNQLATRIHLEQVVQGTSKLGKAMVQEEALDAVRFLPQFGWKCSCFLGRQASGSLVVRDEPDHYQAPSGSQSVHGAVKHGSPTGSYTMSTPGGAPASGRHPHAPRYS